MTTKQSTSSTRPPLVLYGAGRNAALFWEQAKNMNYEPICFVDADENKHGRNYLGLPVLKLSDIDKNNAHIYISVTVPLKYEIQEYLTNECGIRKEQIINHENVQYYKSCYYIESAMIISRGEIYTCCYQGDFRPAVLPKIKMADNPKDSVDAYVSYRDNLIAAHKCGGDSPCNQCAELQYGYWHDEKKIISLAYFAFYPCNLRCVYCDIHKTIGGELESEINFVNNFHYNDYIECLESKGLVGENMHIEFSAGEIALNPNKTQIFKKIKEYPAFLFSNCTIFDEQINEIIANSNSVLITSLDCGTKETFLKIKGIDLFDKVVENICRYRKSGNVQLKYIIILENTSEADMEGFVNVCKHCNILAARISCDINYNHNELPQDIVEFAIRLAVALIQNDVESIILPHFGDENNKLIEKAISEVRNYAQN